MMLSEFFEFSDSERHVIDLSRVLAFSKSFDDERAALEIYTSTTEFFTLQYHDMSMRNFDFEALVRHLTGMPFAMGGAE